MDINTPSTWGVGTTLGYAAVGTTNPNSFTTILRIVEIDEKKIKRKMIKTTTLDSPAYTEECRAGMIEVQPFKLKMIWFKDVHATLLTMAKNRDPNMNWLVTFSDGSTASGPAFISEINEIPKVSIDEVYMDNVELQPTSAWAYTPAA